MAMKRIEVVSESMFYTLMVLQDVECSGSEIATHIEQVTAGRVRLGPATLYTILGHFQESGVITVTRTEGHKRFYRLTDKGVHMYETERLRLEQCVEDATDWEVASYEIHL